MTEDDNIRIEELFRAAAQQEIADDGFTDRVMASLPVEECAVRATAPQMAGADAAAARRRRSDVQKTRPFPLISREAERPRFAYFFRYSRGVMPKCALNARLK